MGGPIGEEPGWRGYALPELLEELSSLPVEFDSGRHMGRLASTAFLSSGSRTVPHVFRDLPRERACPLRIDHLGFHSRPPEADCGFRNDGRLVFTLGVEAMIEDRSPLKRSVHKVCVPNLHVALFGGRKEGAISYSSSDFCLHPDCGSALRSLKRNSSTANAPGTAMRGDHEQGRRRDRVSYRASTLSYRISEVVRRNRKTVYGWIATGEIGEADGLFVVQGRFSDPQVRSVPCKAVQASRKTMRAEYQTSRRNLKMAWLETDRHGRPENRL